MFPSDPLWPYNDVAAGSREHGDWLASNVRARLCREVDAAGGWFQYIAGEKFKEVAFMQEGVYADCLQRKTEASDDARHQIDLDLHRTVITEKGDSPLIAPLAQVLSAYAVHNPKVGYCQGMNFITAMCLHVMTQEEAFWVLAYMAERVVPDYFSNMEGAIADKACIDWMLGISAPELSHKLEQFEGLPTIMWQALLCVFANNIVPTEAVFVFWAALFNKGRVFLVRVICQLLANCSGVILAADSTEDIRAGVTAYMNTLYDAVSVVAAVDQDAWDDPGRPCWLAYPSAKIWKQRDALMHSYKQELADHQQDLELMHVARATRLPVELLTRWSTEFHWVCRQGARKGPAAKGMAFPAFRKVMHNVGFDSQTLNLAKLFELWDKSGSRTVHFLELVTGLVTLSDKASIQGRLHICFSTYDVNDSGCLEAEEVQAMMASRHWCEVLGSPGARSLFDADGTVQGCNFCYVLAAFEALPLTLRDGVKLSSTRLYRLEDDRDLTGIPSLIGNTVKTLGSGLGKALDSKLSQMNPALMEAAHNTFWALQARHLGLDLGLQQQQPLARTSSLLQRRLRASETTAAQDLLLVPPYEIATTVSVLWETYWEERELGVCMQKFVPKGKVGSVFKGIQFLRGDVPGNYRLLSTAKPYYVLACPDSEADANVVCGWFKHYTKTRQDVAWHIKAHVWLHELRNTRLIRADGPGRCAAQGSSQRCVSEVQLQDEAATHTGSCQSAEQLWDFYQKVKELPNPDLVPCTKPAFQARIPALFLHWIEQVDNPCDMDAIEEWMTAKKPGYDTEDSIMMDLALNRVKAMQALISPRQSPQSSPRNSPRRSARGSPAQSPPTAPSALIMEQAQDKE